MLSAILCFALLLSQAPAWADTHGVKPTLTEVTSLGEAIQNFKKYESRDVLLSGRTGKVCEAKGCWMMFIDGQSAVRITFKDYGFFVPKDSADKPVTVQGRMQRATESVKEQQHYLKDAGASAAEISAVKKPKEVYSVVASGVVFSK